MITFPLWFKIVIGIVCLLVLTGTIRWRGKNGYLRGVFNSLPIGRKEEYLNATEILIKRHSWFLRIMPVLYLPVIYIIYDKFPEYLVHALFIILVIYLFIANDFSFKKSVARSIREDEQWHIQNEPGENSDTIPLVIRMVISESGSNSDGVGKVLRWILLSISTVIAVALVAFTVLIFVLSEHSRERDIEMSIMATSVVGSFAIFFCTISWCGIRSLMAGRKEIMQVKGWRILGGVLTLFGVVGTLFGHWISVIVALPLALFCLAKNHGVERFLGRIGFGS